MQRADRLFAEGRWNEAAAAYRELLRREPHSGDADRWRRRLTLAENADVSERNAKAPASASAGKPAADADSATAHKADEAPPKAPHGPEDGGSRHAARWHRAWRR